MPNTQTALFVPPEPTLGLLYAPPALALAAPRRKPGRSMQAPILRPIDLRKTHGFDVTPKRLHEIVDTYDPVNIEAATLNFDHTQQGPSHGLASKLWFEGDIVWGQWDDLSDEAVSGLESERWGRRSAEIDLAHAATGGWYLTGLALLGAKPPAVFGLAPAMLLSRQPYRLQLDAGGKENPMPPETTPPVAPTAPAPETPAEDTVLPPTEAEEAEATEATPPTPAELEEEEAAPAQSLAGDTPTPIVMVDPPAAVAAATLSADSGAAAESLRLSAENAALSARLTAANRTVLLHQVQAELAACKGVSPGVLRTGVAEAITELRLSAQPLTANLSAAGGAVVATPLADIFLAAFAALPPIQALEATPLANRDADPAENGDHRTAAERQAHLRAGLTDESYLQLSRKYGFNQPIN